MIINNRIFAIKRNDEFWAAIDCGPSKEGGFTFGNFNMRHFKKNGITYRWYQKLFMPPDDLKEWDEIRVITKEVTVVDKEGNAFQGWEDGEDEGYIVLREFAKLIGRDMSIEEIKKLIKNEECN